MIFIKNNKLIISIAVLAIIVIAAILLFQNQKAIYLKSTHPLKYMDEVEKYAEEFSVNKYLLLAFIKTESGFDPNAKSSANAIGLTQITNETFEWIKLKLCPKEAWVFEDLYNPELSIRFGAYYISKSLDRYNYDISTAAAGYHSGWGTVDTLLLEQQSEKLVKFPYTQMKHYVYKIDKAYNQYQEIYNT